MSSPDISEFVAASKVAYSHCLTGTLLKGLKPAERAKVEAALAADRRLVTAKGIADVLKSKGHKVSPQSVRRHRRGECGCNA